MAMPKLAAGGEQAEQARDRVVAIMAARLQISPDDAARRFDEAQAQLTATRDQAVQTAKVAADETASAASKAAFLAFAALLLGGAAAAIGGSMAAASRSLRGADRPQPVGPRSGATPGDSPPPWRSLLGRAPVKAAERDY